MTRSRTLQTRMLVLMSQLRWNGVDNWNDLDERVQQTYIPMAQSWVLQHVEFLPEYPNKDGHTPRNAIQEYFTLPQIEHDWRRQNAKTMGIVALVAMYNLERSLGVFDR